MMKISGNYVQSAYKAGIAPNFKANVQLSFRDCINLIAEPALLDKGINTCVSHDAKRICKQLTNMENITPLVVKECKKQLLGINEVFGRVSESITRFLRSEDNSASRLSEGLFVKQKAKLVKAFGKDTYKIKMPQVVISQDALAQEAKQIAHVKAQNIAKDYTKRSEMTPFATKVYNKIARGSVNTIEDMKTLFAKHA